MPQATRNTINLEKYVSNEATIRAIKAVKKAMQKVEYNPFEILLWIFPMLLRRIH